MRSYIASFVLVAACASSPPTGEPTYHSVRDRLGKTPTRLFIGAAGSSGSITAQRYTHDGWVDGMTTLSITSGEMIATSDRNGSVKLGSFDVGVDPIDIPESVFGRPAQLRDVRITLATAANANTMWTTEDDATAKVTLALDLSWSIAVNGGVAPLGTQHLPPIDVALSFTGSGDHVDGTFDLHAMGELWSWAGLMKLTELQLSLTAATVD
jgi:hypothetical protein